MIPTYSELNYAATTVIESCRTMATFTDNPANTTRLYLTPAVCAAHNYLRARMARLGMEVTLDAVGNLHGVYAGEIANAPRLILASHIDTVPDSGSFDGVLGVMMGIAMVELLAGEKFPFAIEVIAFPEEEGVRFRLPFLGSRALVGTLDAELLERKDANGVSIAEAIREFGLDPAQIADACLVGGEGKHQIPDYRILGYFEIHIEQGPVLESLQLPLGVVSGIAGQTRVDMVFRGQANHAGTTPMPRRRDALTAAAEWITAVEKMAERDVGLVATVGRIEALPGVGNVVPGEVTCSLDIRHAVDAIRHDAVTDLITAATQIAARREIECESRLLLEQAAVPMDPALTQLLAHAVQRAGYAEHRMPSGAGHDAMIVAPYMPAAMLFLRSPGGISHHPDESVLVEDVSAALASSMCFLRYLAAR